MADDTPSRALTIVRPKRLSPHWRKHFLEKLASSSDVPSAAQASGVSPDMITRALTSESEFAEGWKAALAQGYHQLEMELLRRFRSGDMSTDDKTKYDFANAIRFLSLMRDSSTSLANTRQVSASEVRASIDQKLEEIRTRIEQGRKSEANSS